MDNVETLDSRQQALVRLGAQLSVAG